MLSLQLFQYYFNPHTQQYMYWDGDKKIYIPAATEQANAEGAPTTVDPDSPFAVTGKEKKDKPKNKTAQQVFTNVVFSFLGSCANVQMENTMTFALLQWSINLFSVHLLHYDLFCLFFFSSIDCQRHGALGKESEQTEGEHALCRLLFCIRFYSFADWLH